MSIEYRMGSMFDQKDVNVIIHQANCFNTMGSGVAKQIVDRYPEAREADNATKKGDKDKLGRITVAQGKDGKYVINMYSQFAFLPRGVCHTDYDAMREALNLIVERYAGVTPKVIMAIPFRIGCTRGGGDWNTVNNLLIELFKENNDIHLVVCRYDMN